MTSDSTVPGISPQQLAFLLLDIPEALYGGAAGGGKQLPLDMPVPTPTGWSTIGELRVGDQLFDEQGQVCYVTDLYPVDLSPTTYRLTFDDKTVMDACADHQWLTFDYGEMSAMTRRTDDYRARRRTHRSSRGTGARPDLALRNTTNTPPTLSPPTGTVRTTKDIAQTVLTMSGRTNHAISIASALDLPEADLPLDPYLFGCWLGDGTSAAGSVTSMDEPIFAAFDEGFTRGRTNEVRGRARTVSYLGLFPTLQRLNVAGSGRKHIPNLYLRASVGQRLALLQGLMDTDGTVAKHSGSPEFTTTNRQLGIDTHELILTLGWKVTLREGIARLNGKAIGPKWTIKWQPDTFVFRLERKRSLQRLAVRRTVRFRYITSCEEVNPVPMRCIRVDSPSHLFLAGRSMVPTHNSEALLLGALQDVDEWPVSSLLLRRTYRDLDKPGGLMYRARQWLTPTRAHWDGINYRWTFPSGATLNFGFIDHEGDELKFQCFTPDHTILTDRGWVGVADIQVGDMAATMDPSTRRMSFQPVSHVWSYDYDSDTDGQMVEVGYKTGSHISFQVTPNHTVWASTDRVDTLHPYRADELPLVARIPQFAAWDEGDTVDSMEVRSFTSDGHNGRTVSFQPDTWAQFLGWFISEGSTDPNRWSVNISQVKEEGRLKIKQMLVDAGVNYWEGERAFTFSNKALVLWLRDNVGHYSYQKRLPKEVHTWGRRRLRLLIEALVDGDGTWCDGTRLGVYITSSRQLADDVAEIAVKAGYRATMTMAEPHPPGSRIEQEYGTRPRWRVNLVERTPDTDTVIRGNVRRVDYQGKVHCVTVPPHHTVLVRRNGRMSWSGQSSEYQYVGFDELTHFPEHQYIYLYSRLRRLKGSPVKLRLRGGTNPGGPGHEWVRKRYNLPKGTDPSTGRVFISANLHDNPFLEREEYEAGLSQLGDVTRAQLLHGDWTATSSGGYFNVQNFRHCLWDDVPDPANIAAIVRYWDFAATEPSELNPDPDYTVGVKLAMTVKGSSDPMLPDWYVLDVKRFRGGPGMVEAEIKATARLDGSRVTQWLEQERGSAGKHLTRHFMANVLPEYSVRPLYATGTKEARAAIAAARVDEGRIFLVDGPWIEDFRSECGVFPLGSHDDQVDALSNALICADKERMMVSGGDVERKAHDRQPISRRINRTPLARSKSYGW